MTRFLTLLLLVACPPTVAQVPEVHCKHFFYGYPTGTPATNDLIIRDLYALSSNDTTKFADWVAYRLSPVTVADRAGPDRKWRADPYLDDDETLERQDYDGANGALGTERGHQAPLAAFKGSVDFRQTNYLSNITPQQRALNNGAWKKLEMAVRDLVRDSGGVLWVMTGPLYEGGTPCPANPAANTFCLPNADEPHRIPSGYWKVIATGERGNPSSVKATAFIFAQNTPSGADFTNHIVSIDDVEQRTGLEFFREMSNSQQIALEANPASWPP